MSDIRQMIFSGWNFMRIIRLAMGVFMGANAIMMHDAFSGLLSVIFLFQALTNTGCCCAGSCGVALPKNNKAVETETIFEEIKKD
ncbi:MAG TPA: hypothetical protein VKT28_14045 [Puia sp.]|nr:hypothetical protein [Puia sp.]